MIATNRRLAHYFTFVLIGLSISALPAQAFEALYFAKTMKPFSVCGDGNNLAYCFGVTADLKLRSGAVPNGSFNEGEFWLKNNQGSNAFKPSCNKLECLTVPVQMEEDETEYEGGDEPYGFRDLIIGARGGVIADKCKPNSSDNSYDVVVAREPIRIYYNRILTECYNLDGVRFGFRLEFDENFYLETRVWEGVSSLVGAQLDKGTITSIFAYAGLDEGEYFEEIYNEMAKKYPLDWTFDDNVVRLFNERSIDSLWTSFAGGQVMIQITPNDENNAIYVHYYNSVLGNQLMKARRPKVADIKEF